MVHGKAMGWASHYIDKLRAGERVQFRPKGNSMQPKIESGQLCTVVPVKDAADVRDGDVVLCRVHGAEYLHLVKSVQGDRFLIGNNKGRTNGWVGVSGIFGRLVAIEP